MAGTLGVRSRSGIDENPDPLLSGSKFLTFGAAGRWPSSLGSYAVGRSELSRCRPCDGRSTSGTEPIRNVDASRSIFDAVGRHSEDAPTHAVRGQVLNRSLGRREHEIGQSPRPT